MPIIYHIEDVQDTSESFFHDLEEKMVKKLDIKADYIRFRTPEEFSLRRIKDKLPGIVVNDLFFGQPGHSGKENFIEIMGTHIPRIFANVIQPLKSNGFDMKNFMIFSKYKDYGPFEAPGVADSIPAEGSPRTWFHRLREELIIAIRDQRRIPPSWIEPRLRQWAKDYLEAGIDLMSCDSSSAEAVITSVLVQMGVQQNCIFSKFGEWNPLVDKIMTTLKVDDSITVRSE